MTGRWHCHPIGSSVPQDFMPCNADPCPQLMSERIAQLGIDVGKVVYGGSGEHGDADPGDRGSNDE